ncbi:MAG: hypothetical protein CVV27_14870 [Candidatus Melainabacteria bacterium HGW-Melainabacteria-1]|nr:MAG: hypothetical protein CVV27_14870 [Candidatus Melainabacteria bacterium HGW-Melainabacteria-1]
MKQSVRTLAPLFACLILSACGGNPMNSQMAYPQQYSQPGYGQAGMNAYAQPGMAQPGMAQPGINAYAQPGMSSYGQNSQSLNAPMGPEYGAQPQAAYPPQNTYPQQTAARSAQQTQVRLPANSRPTPNFSNPGSAPVSSAPRTPAPVARTSAPAKAPASRPAAPAQATPSASEFLSKAHQASNGLQSLSATIATFEKGATAGQGKIQYYYRNGQVKIDVTASSDSSRQGVKISFQSGGNQAKVRPSGILKMVSLTLNMNDPKLLSGRKYQIGQIELITTVNRLAQGAAKARVLGKSSFAGSEIIVLEITAPNPFDPRITKEHLGIDAKTFLPRVHEMYEGSELVYAGRVEQMSPNAPISDAMMAI